MTTYTKIELNEDITLSWYSPQTSDYIVSDFNDVISNNDSRTMRLPDATLTNTGQSMVFNNVGSYDFTLLTFDGQPFNNVIRPGEVVQLYLFDNADQNGKWRIIPFGGGISAISALSFESKNKSLDITNSTITPPGGNVEFSISESLDNLNSLTGQTTPGNLRVINNDVNLVFATFNYTTDGNITIDSDNVSLNKTITVEKVILNNTTISDGNISCVDGNDLKLTSTTGDVFINNLRVDNENNIITNGGLLCTEIKLLGKMTAVESVVAKNTPKAFAFFYDNNLPAENIVIEKSHNIASIKGAQGSYVVNFTEELEDSNYAVILSLQKSVENITPFSAFFRSKTSKYFILYTVDTNGNLLPALDGVSVLVL